MVETTTLIPPLLTVLLAALLGGLIWSILRARRVEGAGQLLEVSDHILLGGLLLGATAMGVFVVYVLLHRLL